MRPLKLFRRISQCSKLLCCHTERTFSPEVILCCCLWCCLLPKRVWGALRALRFQRFVQTAAGLRRDHEVRGEEVRVFSAVARPVGNRYALNFRGRWVIDNVRSGVERVLDSELSDGEMRAGLGN